jgi:hypothetical protein
MTQNDLAGQELARKFIALHYDRIAKNTETVESLVS